MLESSRHSVASVNVSDGRIRERTRTKPAISRLRVWNLYALEHLFHHRVLCLLLQERRFDESVIRTLLGWRHSGCSLHNGVRIGAADPDGRRGVAEYILRSPFSVEKMRYQASTGTIS